MNEKNLNKNLLLNTNSYHPFSIDNILKKHHAYDHEWQRRNGDQKNEPGGDVNDAKLNKNKSDSNNSTADHQQNERPDFTKYPAFDWLQCSRYKPPKVTRVKRRKYVPLNVSRQPRIPFTPYQQSNLEAQFHQRQYLTSQRLCELSDILNLPKQRIKIWYQNRRARERREENMKIKHKMD